MTSDLGRVATGSRVVRRNEIHQRWHLRHQGQIRERIVMRTVNIILYVACGFLGAVLVYQLMGVVRGY